MTDQPPGKKTQSGVLKAVSTLKQGDRSEHLYDAWAEDYDQHLKEDWGYVAPRLAADALEKHCPDRQADLADLGCGTGLVGQELIARGYTTLDGLDISQGMLDQAQAKGHYRHLLRADLTQPIPLPEASYDTVLCIGSMGWGHLDPTHVPEMLRLVRPKGYLIIYANGEPYVAENYEAALRAHEKSGLWQILSIEASNYMEQLNRPGRLVVGRKNN